MAGMQEWCLPCVGQQSGYKDRLAPGLNWHQWVLPLKMLGVLLGLVFLLLEGLQVSSALHHQGEVCPYPFIEEAQSGWEGSFAPRCHEIPVAALQEGHSPTAHIGLFPLDPSPGTGAGSVMCRGTGAAAGVCSPCWCCINRNLMAW